MNTADTHSLHRHACIAVPLGYALKNPSTAYLTYIIVITQCMMLQG